MKSTFQNIWFWITIVILVLFLWKSCGKGSIGFFGCNKGDTLSHKIDTSIRKSFDSISYVPVPYKVDSVVYVPKWYETVVYNDMTPNNHPEYNEVTDTCNRLLSDYNILSDDYNELFKKYNSTKYYEDSFNLKGVRGKITERVKQNKILDRKITTVVDDTTIKESTEILKHKIVAYAGFKLFGSSSDIFKQGEINFGIKGKNDMIYTAGIGRERGSKENIYSFEVKLPIRLFKKRKN